MQVRAKYMALDPGVNRYVKHLRQIRVIQDYLVTRAERHGIPRVDNTNVDRSVAAIHATVLSCLKRQHRVCFRILRTLHHTLDAASCCMFCEIFALGAGLRSSCKRKRAGNAVSLSQSSQ